MKEPYKSRVYTERPAYADYDAPEKFEAIKGIIVHRLIQHPKAICSYSGGADSDIMIDVIERARATLDLPPIKYVFFNTGLEMQATKDHVKATSEKYEVEIETVRPKAGIVQAVRKHGIPFMSKIISRKLGDWQKRPFPLTISDEYNQCNNKAAKIKELDERYPNSKAALRFICGCGPNGEKCRNSQLWIGSSKYLLDFIKEFPPDFKISSKCCDCCKKSPAHSIQKNFDMIITGERIYEGGIRAISPGGCFTETSYGQFRLRPLYYVSDADKQWYKDRYGIRYSDAYEVYGLTRTGCCGCPISYKAVDDLELIRPYEPNVVKAAWNIFGASYEYRAKYNAYKEQRNKSSKIDPNQITFDDL